MSASNRPVYYAMAAQRQQPIPPRIGDTGEISERTKLLFDQHWLQARHAENLRVALLSIYGVMVSGCLAALREGFFGGTSLALWVRTFLMLLAVSFGIMCYKMGLVFSKHSWEADRILPDDGPKMLDKILKGHWSDSRLFSVRLHYVAFFAFCLVALLVISIVENLLPLLQRHGLW